MEMSGKKNAGEGKRNNRSRRSWTLREERELIVGLKDVVARGLKCENGFKVGYLQVLEKHIQQTLPGCDLKAEPHINSKIHVWRKDYGSLATMLSRSGFGWSESSHSIEVISDQVWDDYVKTDSNARTMRSKSWPYYNDWCEIFGKDRATGEHAEGFADVVQEPHNKDQFEDVEGFTLLNEDPESEANFMPTSREGTSSGTKVNERGKKRKNHDSLDARFLELMSTFCEKTDSRLGELVQRIGVEHDAAALRKDVFEALGKITSLSDLSDEQQISVAMYLCNNNNDLQLFFSLPDDNKKAVMVRMILRKGN